MASAAKKPKNTKRAEVTGWSPQTVDLKLKNMNKNKVKGDWRRDVQVEDVLYKVATVTWTHLPSMRTFAFPSPIPVGMEKLLTKLESAQNRSFKSLPLAVREEFTIMENSYNPANFEVRVTFSEAMYGNFRLLYCRLCTTKKNLKEKFWDKFPEKLPADNISRKALMRNWDELNLSWNSQDVLGCLLPNNPKHYSLINARRFIRRPISHWETVHEEKKKSQKTQITLPTETPSSSAESSSTPVVSSVSGCSSTPSSESPSSPSSSTGPSSTLASSSTVVVPSTSKTSLSDKLNYRKKSTLRQPTISDLTESRIDFKGHSPKNLNEQMGLGHALKVIHVGANKMISSTAVLEHYYSTVEMKTELYEFYKTLNKDAIRTGTCILPRPVVVRLNDHNINDGYEAILKAYQKYNLDEDNPYRILEKVVHWGYIHDATSHWVKELNTVILRAVDERGNITKVPFSFNQVPGSLTGEVLAEEIISNISAVKTVKNINAASNISDALVSSSNNDNTHDNHKQLEELRQQLQEAASALDFENMNVLKAAIQRLQEEMSNADHSSITKDTIIPAPPKYFNIASLKGIDHTEKTIYLEISPENVPTSICGDSCKTNLKANRLVTEWYGLKSPQADCSSHAASGTIRRTCTSVTMCDPDATALYNSLRKVLRHFSMSAKSTELLNNALHVLEQNDIHMLVWGGTRMAGFLDGCKQCSGILVPFIDTLIVGKIREEESAVLLSPKGLYTLELFADLHPIFANQYLHAVDSDKVLGCEVHDIAHKTANKLVDPSLSTPKADIIFNSLSVDNNNNVCVTLLAGGVTTDDDGEADVPQQHTHILNEKLTRHRTFQSVKDGLKTTRENILKRLHDNIVDQVSDDSIFYLLNAFDLTSRESFDNRITKVKQLHKIFGNNVEHVVKEKWFDFDIHITYKARLHCSEDELVKQFKAGQGEMTSLAHELREDRIGVICLKLTQHQQWLKFINRMGMECPDLCNLITVMISIPPNSGWVERAYSYLDQVCHKKRNRTNIEKPLKELFFLALLKLKPKDSQGYLNEIKILSGELL